MFSLACIMVAGALAAYAVEEYKFIAVVVFMEFILHEIAHQYGIIDTQAFNSSLLFAVYMIINTVALAAMYLVQTHKVIAILIFANLVYNFLSVLNYIFVKSMFFYNSFSYVVGVIMFLELLYLLRINQYVAELKRSGTVDFDNIDRLFFIRRRIPVGNMGRQTA